MKKFLLAVLLYGAVIGAVAQKQKQKKDKEPDTVSLEIINADNTVKKVSFEWPLANGPAPVGGKKEVIEKVNAICSANGIDCPPQRQKVSEGIWLCGNGKKIKSNSLKLTKLLSAAWDN